MNFTSRKICIFNVWFIQMYSFFFKLPYINLVTSCLILLRPFHFEGMHYPLSNLRFNVVIELCGYFWSFILYNNMFDHFMGIFLVSRDLTKTSKI